MSCALRDAARTENTTSSKSPLSATAATGQVLNRTDDLQGSRYGSRLPRKRPGGDTVNRGEDTNSSRRRSPTKGRVFRPLRGRSMPDRSDVRDAVDLDQGLVRQRAHGDGRPDRGLGAEPADVGGVHAVEVVHVRQVHVHLEY